MIASVFDLPESAIYNKLFQQLCISDKRFGGLGIIIPGSYKHFYDKFGISLENDNSKCIWNEYKADIKTDGKLLGDKQCIAACGV